MGKFYLLEVLPVSIYQRKIPSCFWQGKGEKNNFETWSMLSFSISASLKRNLTKALSTGVLSEAN